MYRDKKFLELYFKGGAQWSKKPIYPKKFHN
jgi:hypothetical protein